MQDLVRGQRGLGRIWDGTLRADECVVDKLDGGDVWEMRQR